MAWKFEYCTDGSTWIEIDKASVPIESVRHVSQRHRDLKPSTDTFEFTVRFPTTAFLNAILSSNAFEFKSSLDGSAIFRGWVSSESKADVRRRLESIAVTAYDESWLLDTKIGAVINWQNFYISKAADTAHSIVHQLMLQYGLSLARIDPEDDLTQIDYFVAEADETFDELLTRLLFEFGWIYYFDADSILKTEALFPDDPTATVTFDVLNISQPMTVERKPVQKDGIEVTYWAHETITDALVSSDTTGGDTAHKMNVAIAAGDYYPVGSGTNDIFTNLSVADRELIVALNGTIESAYEAGIVQSSPTWYPKKLLISYHNTAGVAKDLTQFDAIADAVVKGDKGILRVYNADELKADLSEISARFLTTFAQASYLTSGSAQYYKYSSLSYLFRSRDLAAVGAIAQLTDTVSGISQLCRVYARATSWQVDGVAIYEYALEGVAAYSLQTIVTVGEHDAPPSLPRPVAELLAGAMTKVELINGFDGSGGTTTPTVPTIAYAKGAGRNIAIIWDRQLNLTNFERYELQVSEDETDWYSLKFDGTDWKDTLDAVSYYYPEVAVHTLIPLAGDSTTPTDRVLYYRVRRVTKAAVSSAWSTSVSATASAMASGDIAAASIIAEKLAVGILDALIANISQYIQISSDGVLGQNFTGAPYEGAQRCRIYQSGLIVEEYLSAAWVTRVKVGGVENGSIFPWLQAAGLAAVGAADDLSALGLGDSIPTGGDAFEFEDSLTGLLGSTPWTASAGEYTTTKKYGSKAWRSTSGNVGTLTDADAAGINFGRSFAIDGWLDQTAAFQDETVLKVESASPLSSIPATGTFTPAATAQFASDIYRHNENAIQLDSTHLVVAWLRQNGSSLEAHAQCGLRGTTGISWGADKLLASYANAASFDSTFCSWGLCRISSAQFAFGFTKETDSYATITDVILKCSVTGTTVNDVVASFNFIHTTGAGTKYFGGHTLKIGYLDSSTLIWATCQAGLTTDANVGDLRIGILDISAWTETTYQFADTSGYSNGGTDWHGVHPLAIIGLSASKAIVYCWRGDAPSTGTTYDSYCIGLDWTSPNLTFGALQTIYDGTAQSNSYKPEHGRIEKVDSTHAVIQYRGASGNCKLVVAAISGTTLSLGTVYDTTEVEYQLLGVMQIAVLDGATTFNALWTKANGSNRDVRSFRFTVSGTTISAFGSIDSALTAVPATMMLYLAMSQASLLCEHSIMAIAAGVITCYAYATTYTRILIQCQSTGSAFKFLLDNFGADPETGSAIVTTAGSAWYHLSLNFDFTAKSIGGTVGSTAITPFAMSTDQMNTGTHSLVITSNAQRQIWDDLLILPASALTTALSVAHAASGNPWSAIDYDADLDVALFPRAGGNIVLFGGTLKNALGDPVVLQANIEKYVEAAYTPTFTGFGTPSAVNFTQARVGNRLKVMGKMTTGTCTAAEARISLPGSLVSDAALVPNIEVCGIAIQLNAATTFFGLYCLIESGVGYITIGAQTSVNSGQTKANGNAISPNNQPFMVMFELPVSGWNV